MRLTALNSPTKTDGYSKFGILTSKGEAERGKVETSGRSDFRKKKKTNTPNTEEQRDTFIVAVSQTHECEIVKQLTEKQKTNEKMIRRETISFPQLVERRCNSTSTVYKSIN